VGDAKPMRVVRTHDASVLVVGGDVERELARAALADSDVRLDTCSDIATALERLASEPVDVVIASDTLPDGSAKDLLESVRRERSGGDFIAICNSVPSEFTSRDGVRGVDVLTRPVDAYGLRRMVEQILLRRTLMEENRHIRDTLDTIERCRELSRCIEPGSVYPVAIDLLLGSLSRSRGLALFKRTTAPLSAGAAFRGFSDGESGQLRDLLIGDKPLDVGEYTDLEVVDHGPLQRAFTHLGVEAPVVLSVPIMGQAGEAGVAWLLEDGRRFEPFELERAKLIAGYATTALENAERYHQAKERAFIDDVTEVYNARYLLSAAENELRRAERYGNPLSVLFLDLDRFKLVNDRFGHLVGSRTLRSLSQVLLQCVRQVDTLARYGGDEFTILLVDTEHEEAMRIAQRIRRTVEEHVFEASGDGSLRLTISIGVASYPSDGASRDTLLDGADKAMYRAKSLGRNRVCSASELGD
jgi:two-component system cell cycle response regulator